jgi:hypothetical protein
LVAGVMPQSVRHDGAALQRLAGDDSAPSPSWARSCRHRIVRLRRRPVRIPSWIVCPRTKSSWRQLRNSHRDAEKSRLGHVSLAHAVDRCRIIRAKIAARKGLPVGDLIAWACRARSSPGIEVTALAKHRSDETPDGGAEQTSNGGGHHRRGVLSSALARGSFWTAHRITDARSADEAETSANETAVRRRPGGSSHTHRLHEKCRSHPQTASPGPSSRTRNPLPTMGSVRRGPSDAVSRCQRARRPTPLERPPPDSLSSARTLPVTGEELMHVTHCFLPAMHGRFLHRSHFLRTGAAGGRPLNDPVGMAHSSSFERTFFKRLRPFRTLRPASSATL